MPFANIDGIRHFYRLDGRDDRPAIVFSHSLGLDHGQWDHQAADLLPHFRVLRYDIRGHGATDAPPGEYSLERLARDILGIADAAGVAQFAFCGLSLGGMIGQWLGANAGERVTHLVLANTSPRYGNPQVMEDRRAAVAAAIHEAAPGDIVLLAGKGHEKMQITREGAIPFDDVQVARQLLSEAGYECESANTAERSL